MVQSGTGDGRMLGEPMQHQYPCGLFAVPGYVQIGRQCIVAPRHQGDGRSRERVTRHTHPQQRLQLSQLRIRGADQGDAVGRGRRLPGLLDPAAAIRVHGLCSLGLGPLQAGHPVTLAAERVAWQGDPTVPPGRVDRQPVDGLARKVAGSQRVPGLATHHGAMRMVFAAGAKRVGDVVRAVLMAVGVQPALQLGHPLAQGRLAHGGHGKQRRCRAARRCDHPGRFGRCLYHEVHVGPTESECAHGRTHRPSRPGLAIGRNVEGAVGEVNGLVGAIEVQRGHDLAVMH